MFRPPATIVQLLDPDTLERTAMCRSRGLLMASVMLHPSALSSKNSALAVMVLGATLDLGNGVTDVI